LGGTERNGDSVFLNEPIKGQVHSTRGYSTGHEISEINKGRFPANLILQHHPECECKGLKKVKSDGHHSGKVPIDGGLLKLGLKQKEDEGNKYADENGEETIEDWHCVENCPIRIMDEQSGISKSFGGSGEKSKGTLGVNGKYGKYSLDIHGSNSGGLGDTGGASRFFYCAKASKSERNKGLEGFEEKFQANANHRPNHLEKAKIGDSGKPHGRFTPETNFHPTVKPVKLMQYLVRLITPSNGKVLDPFCGSGTTGIACKLEGFEFVGLEQDAEYSKIAQSRIDNYEEEIEEIVYVTNNEGEKVQIIQTSLF
jgi:hypothetical protein